MGMPPTFYKGQKKTFFILFVFNYLEGWFFVWFFWFPDQIHPMHRQYVFEQRITPHDKTTSIRQADTRSPWTRFLSEGA